MFHTSDDEIESIALKEGFRAKAYRPGPTSNLTIGYGQEHALFPGTTGEIPVTEDLEIDEHTAKQALYFFTYNVVDPLVSEHFNPQNQAEHDACASFVYNIKLSKLKRGEYTLPKLVCRADRGPDALQEILEKWWEYCLTPGFETGLARRRIIETIKFLGYPLTPAVMGMIMSLRVANLTRGERLENAAYTHPTGKFEASIDPNYILDMAESYDDLSENDQTAALNNAEARDLGADVEVYIPPDTPKVKPKKVKAVETPKLNPSAEPKPMEQSTTAKGMAQQKAGADQVIVGTVTTTMAGVATAREVTKGIKEVNATAADVKGILFGITLEQLAMLGLMVGGIWLIVGLVRWQAGRIRKAVGRAEAEQAKI